MIGKKGIAILGAVAYAYNIVIILGILYQLHRAARRNTGPASRYFGLIRGESKRHPAHSRVAFACPGGGFLADMLGKWGGAFHAEKNARVRAAVSFPCKRPVNGLSEGRG